MLVSYMYTFFYTNPQYDVVYPHTSSFKHVALTKIHTEDAYKSSVCISQSLEGSERLVSVVQPSSLSSPNLIG